EAELESAIVEPARRADPRRPVAVEPALVRQLVADFSGQAGELPLVQFALTRLWREQTGPVLTLGGYATLGGARRALTDFADGCGRGRATTGSPCPACAGPRGRTPPGANTARTPASCGPTPCCRSPGACSPGGPPTPPTCASSSSAAGTWSTTTNSPACPTA